MMFSRKERGTGRWVAGAVLASIVFLSGSALASAHYVKYHSLIPQLLWCQGCTPTSTSMAMGYWDNYVPGASHLNLGAGRTIDYWRWMNEWRDGSGAMRNVPNTHAELLKGLHTDYQGGKYLSRISPGILYVANRINHYGYKSTLTMGSKANGYCWKLIRSEITASRPFVWSCGATNMGHSLCAWGYTDTKYFIVYNTWNYGTDEWYYRKYDNGPKSVYQSVNTIIPAKLTTSNALFIRPLKRSTYTAGTQATLSWVQYGSLISRAHIYYSVDGGGTWHKITVYAHSRAGNNHYSWTVPDNPSASSRVKILGYRGTSYIAGDGLKSDFTIESPGP